MNKDDIKIQNDPVNIDFRNGAEHVEDESHLISDCPAYKDLRENLFETLKDKMQINLSSLSHDIQTFTVLNPDSS